MNGEEQEAVSVKVEENKDEKYEKFHLSSLCCTICKNQFPNKKAFNNHKTNHHDDRTFTCLNCGKEFVGIKRFSDHMRSYQFVTCQNCGKDIKSKNKNKHLRLCLIKKEKVKTENIEELCCDFCDYKSIIKVNMKIHTERKHIKRSCGDCQKEFDGQAMLNKHIRQIHVKKVPKLTKCKWDNCLYTTKITSNVRRHELYCSWRSRDVVTWF